MSYKPDKDMIEELNQTIKKKDPKEPIEKTLITFCAKTGISMDTCKVYYKQLEKKGKIKEK
jgi:ribosomal protein L19E